MGIVAPAGHVPPLPDGAVLVRALFEVYDHGGDYDRDVLIGDVTYNFDEFGYYGLSLWLVSETWTLDRLRAEKTRKAARVALYTAGDLAEHGLKLVASGREPHYDVTDGALITADPGVSASRQVAPRNSPTGSWPRPTLLSRTRTSCRMSAERGRSSDPDRHRR